MIKLKEIVIDSYSQLSMLYRILAGITLAAALAAVTFAAFYSQPRPEITEIISGYITVIFMLLLSITDIKTFKLPNVLLLAWLICRVVLMTLTALLEGSFGIVISSVLGSGVAGLLFLLVYYAGKRTMGGGDIKLSFVLGLSLTFTRILNALFFGFVFCALFGIAGLITKKLNRKDAIPLGPFLFAGAIASYIVEIWG